MRLQASPPAFADARYPELKDPCAVHDGSRWHLFGTGCLEQGVEVFHAVAESLDGPWEALPSVDVASLAGSCIAAPGLVADGEILHMFVQTEFNQLDGVVEHLVSDDLGQSFSHARTALTSDAAAGEAGIYDVHPCEVAGERYLVYSAFSVIGQPDVHLARSASGSWEGPWDRLGPVLRHEQVWCHNQRGTEAYEWGLEAAQLVELPDGRVLLNGVCFLPGQEPGTRQRLFLAVADRLGAPWTVLGPVLEPPGGETGGENGHACVVVDGDELVVLYQERSLEDPRWRLGSLRARIEDLVGGDAVAVGLEQDVA